MAKQAISLGMSIKEFDSLELNDVGVVFEGLTRRYELQNEGIIAQLIRQNTFFTARYAPFFKDNSKPKKATDIYKFSREREFEKSELESKKKQYEALAIFLTNKN